MGSAPVHEAAFIELREWWEDVYDGIGSRALLLPVPPRWGRTTVLDRFTELVETDVQRPAILVVVAGGDLRGGVGLQVASLRRIFEEAQLTNHIAALLRVDHLGGALNLTLGIVALSAGGLAAQTALLLASVGISAAGAARSRTHAGQIDDVARLAMRVGRVSRSAPVVVVVDDADLLEPAVAMTLLERLIERPDGQVLAVAATAPDSVLARQLTKPDRIGRPKVYTIDVAADMDEQSRTSLVGEVRSDLPYVVKRRIGMRTSCFAQVFAVIATPGLADIGEAQDESDLVAATDRLIDAAVPLEPPSDAVLVMAWAGGALHQRQWQRIRAVLGVADQAGEVVVSGSLVRCAAQLERRRMEALIPIRLDYATRRCLAAAIVDEAVAISTDEHVPRIERAVALGAAHQVGEDEEPSGPLRALRLDLVATLETLGDIAGAAAVAEAVLRGLPGDSPEWKTVHGTTLRLRKLLGGITAADDASVKALVERALAEGATVSLEGKTWAAVDLLGRRNRLDDAFSLVDQVSAALDGQDDLGAVADEWRLLLAFHVGRVGHPDRSRRLLAPLLTDPANRERVDAAQRVLFAVGGPRADDRLAVIFLEEELKRRGDSILDDDLLNLSSALAAHWAKLGNYDLAQRHGLVELRLRRKIQGNDHADTLRTRVTVALRKGRRGDYTGSIEALESVLPDLRRVMGGDHTLTLAARSYRAVAMAYAGRTAKALSAFEKLLADQRRVLGDDHPMTLTTRDNIAMGIAATGRPDQALLMLFSVLSGFRRTVGDDHPDTLCVRRNIARCTAEAGNKAEGLRLLEELLADRRRVIGDDHSDTLQTRHDVCKLTAEVRSTEEGSRLLEELLSDLRVMRDQDDPQIQSVQRSLDDLREKGTD